MYGHVTVTVGERGIGELPHDAMAAPAHTQLLYHVTSHALRLAFITIRVAFYPIVIITYIHSILVTCSQQDTLAHPVYALPRTPCSLPPQKSSSPQVRGACPPRCRLHAARLACVHNGTPPPSPCDCFMVYSSTPQPQHRPLIACFPLLQADHLLYCHHNAAMRCLSSCLQRAWRRWR